MGKVAQRKAAARLHGRGEGARAERGHEQGKHARIRGLLPNRVRVRARVRVKVRVRVRVRVRVGSRARGSG